jgi:uncharacterized membrane protein YfcA
MQESSRDEDDGEKQTFLRVAYDLMLLVGGGVIGSVVGIYYSRMIPEPSSDMWERLLLSLVIVVVIFFPLLFVMRRGLDRPSTRKRLDT